MAYILFQDMIQTQPYSLKYKRITDKQRHFLGKIANGNIYIYCRRCKEFVLVTIDDKNKDLSKTK